MKTYPAGSFRSACSRGGEQGSKGTDIDDALGGKNALPLRWTMT